jgi:hypothetical protein
MSKGDLVLLLRQLLLVSVSVDLGKANHIG